MTIFFGGVGNLQIKLMRFQLLTNYLNTFDIVKFKISEPLKKFNF